MERIERRLATPMLIAALLTIPAIAIEESHVGETLATFGTVLNWVIWTAFAVEAGLLLSSFGIFGV